MIELCCLIVVGIGLYCVVVIHIVIFILFFFNDTATTEIYTYWHTLSLHDALPIFCMIGRHDGKNLYLLRSEKIAQWDDSELLLRSEEHTSELQSLMRISYAVFCLKKKKN